MFHLCGFQMLLHCIIILNATPCPQQVLMLECVSPIGYWWTTGQSQNVLHWHIPRPLFMPNDASCQRIISPCRWTVLELRHEHKHALVRRIFDRNGVCYNHKQVCEVEHPARSVMCISFNCWLWVQYGVLQAKQWGIDRPVGHYFVPFLA